MTSSFLRVTLGAALLAALLGGCNKRPADQPPTPVTDNATTPATPTPPPAATPPADGTPPPATTPPNQSATTPPPKQQQ